MGEAQLNALGPRPSGFVSGSFIAAQLSEAILSGALQAGTEIRQQQLANHFGVSRMPVREALREVQAKGLLEHRPHRSPVVLPLSANEDSELTQAMARIGALERALSRARVMFDKIARCQQSEFEGCKDYSAMHRSQIDGLLGKKEPELESGQS
jgi:DNA-binding GntR family transcriptional regulator